jgi:hypothetical protein
MRLRSCRWIRRRLSAFAGEDLGAVETGGVRLHLRACSTCRAAAGGWLRARRRLQESAAAAAPASVDDAFFARLHAEVISAVAQEPIPEPRDWRWRGRLRIAAAAALLFGLGLWSVQVIAPTNPGLLERPALRGESGDPESVGAGTGMRPLGSERGVDLDSDSHGLMGRLRLRTLEQEVLEPWRLRPPSERTRPLDRTAPGGSERDGR